MEVLAPTPDSRFSVFDQKLGVDSSSSFETTYPVSAVSNGSNPLGINNSQDQTVFTFESNSSEKISLVDCALELEIRMSNAVDNAPINATSGLPWFTPYLIRNIQITLNDDPRYIYQSTNKFYYLECLQRMMSKYSYHQITEGMENCLMYPIEDPIYHNTALAAQTAQMQARLLNMNHVFYTEKTFKIIPFPILFPFCENSGILSNCRKITLKINWRDKTQIIYRSSIGALTVGDSVRVTTCRVIKSSVVISSSEKLQNRLGDYELLPFYNTESREVKFQNSLQYVVPSINNLHMCAVLFPANEWDNAVITLTAPDQFLFGSCNVMDATGNPLLIEQNIQSVQIKYGSILTPNVPIITTNLSSADLPRNFESLYYYYTKSISRNVQTNFTPGIRYDWFKKTMPMMCLRPWFSNTPHLDLDSKDLIITFAGGVIPATLQGTFCVILQRLNLYKLSADGNVQLLLNL